MPNIDPKTSKKDSSITESILIVDDERSIGVGFCGLQIKERHSVQAASSGEEALQLLEDNPVDLVVTDLPMPGLDGTQELTRIKDQYSGTMVMMMTAYESEKIAVEATKECDRVAKNLFPEAYQSLLQRLWPGNVRELRNAIESALILSPGDPVAAGTGSGANPSSD